MARVAISVGVLLAIVVAGWTLYFDRAYPTASPFTSTSYVIGHVGHPHARMTRQVVGFLPYWQVGNAKYLQTDLLSEVIFFALTIDQHGHIVSQVQNQAEPGWQAWSSSTVRDGIARIQIAGGKVALSVSMQDGVQLGAFLDSAAAQQALIDTLVAQVAKNKLDGVNLDFEFTGQSTPAHRQVFTRFGSRLVGAIHHQAPTAEVSIDLPPMSAEKPGLYDVPGLAAAFDRVIVMSYDYYAAGSDVAGPVAPMSGYKDGKYYFDVTTTYAGYAAAVPLLKLIMGVPYYGEDWPVKDNSKPLALTLPQNDTNGYARSVPYSEIKTDTNLQGSNCHWDATAEETWCAYTDAKTNTPREAWLENARSIGLKFDFARQHQFRGVALWALGFDGSSGDLWTMLRNDFAQPGT